MSYVSAKFTDRTAEIVRIIAQERVPNIPSTTVNLFAEHDIDLASAGNITVRGEAIYRSRYDLLAITQANADVGAASLIQNKAVLIGNVNIGWTSTDNKFSLSGYVRNIANTRTAAALFFTSFAPVTATGTRTDPRTVGAILQARF